MGFVEVGMPDWLVRSQLEFVLSISFLFYR